MIKAIFAGFPPGLYEGLHEKDGHKFHSIYQLPIVIGNIIEIVLAVVGVLAVIYIIYAGIQYIMSSGDPQKISSAKTGITNAIIGLVMASAAYLIVDFIGSRFS